MIYMYIIENEDFIELLSEKIKKNFLLQKMILKILSIIFLWWNIMVNSM